MSKETRGGARLGAGRPATGRERGNFTTTLAPETRQRMAEIGLRRGKRGAFIDDAVENAWLLAKQGEEFEVSVRNLIFSHVEKKTRTVFFGETVRELLQMIDTYGMDDEERQQRCLNLMNAYKYGQWPDDSLSRAFL